MTTPAEQARFFGIFAMLHSLDLPLTTVEPVYSGYFATLYDALSAFYDWDCDLFAGYARESKGPILELGCGSGRVAIPLAVQGHQVVGVDSSPDMLAIFRRRLATQPDEVRDRIRLVQSDMRTLDLEQPFGLVLLPANNISLLRTEADQIAMLQVVRRHLAHDGFFVFDNVIVEPDALRKQDRDLSAFPVSAGGRTQFVLAAHRWFPSENIQVMNFYVESVEPDGNTRRRLSWWTKSLIDEPRLFALLERAGLRVHGSTVRRLTDDHRRVRVYRCAPASDEEEPAC